jgi:ATP-dependent helicase HrpB
VTPLPIDSHLSPVIDALKDHRSLVLVAEPGAGKTTRVPPAIVEAGLLSKEHPNLVMLQPRRVAARAAATRIAQERDWEVGGQVGYQVRFEKRMTAQTRLRVVTEGILNRQLLDDPFLPGVGCVVLDEFHERSIHSDLAIAFLKEIRNTVREDLLIVVMSATLEAEPVAKFLGDAPIVNVPGRTFPIDIRYMNPAEGRLHERVADAVIDAVSRDTAGGHVLVFLPGAEEIRRAAEMLSDFARRESLLLRPLHGTLPFDEQVRALEPNNQRKIILATNIAETSLTVEGVTLVIDSGFARIAGYDAERGLDRLDLKRISQASAKQRAGRAGRTAPGTCVRLWTSKEQEALNAFELPEIQRVDLAQTILAMHGWGTTNPRSFGWFQTPSEDAISSAERLLAMLGALTSETNGSITDLGRQMLALPVHPRLARLMIEASRVGLTREGATLASLLSEKDILRSGDPRDRAAKTTGPSDLLYRLELMEARSELLDRVAVQQVIKTSQELRRFSPSPPAGEGRGEGNDPAKVSSIVRARPTPHPNPLPQGEREQRLLLLTYPDRVVRRRESDHTRGVMVGGGGVRLASESIVTRSEFYLALDARRDDRSANRESLVRIASAIEEEWLEELFPDFLRKTREAVYDEQRQRVVGHGKIFFLDLLIREDKDAAVDPQLASRVLADALAPRALEIFSSDEATSDLMSRVNLLREAMPEQNFPALDAATLADILREACDRKKSLADVKRQSLVTILHNQLHYPLDRLLEQHAPTQLEVPSGSRIRVDYSRKPPALSVRLQELFGWTDTPRVANGRVPVTLELLGPNFRPVQVTQDLRSFWTNTYPQVRKDLRARYPKHSWPEDPFGAKPEAKGRRKG